MKFISLKRSYGFRAHIYVFTTVFVRFSYGFRAAQDVTATGGQNPNICEPAYDYRLLDGKQKTISYVCVRLSSILCCLHRSDNEALCDLTETSMY